MKPAQTELLEERLKHHKRMVSALTAALKVLVPDAADDDVETKEASAKPASRSKKVSKAAPKKTKTEAPVNENYEDRVYAAAKKLKAEHNMMAEAKEVIAGYAGPEGTVSSIPNDDGGEAIKACVEELEELLHQVENSGDYGAPAGDDDGF